MSPPPDRAAVVIIGGGVIGSSIALHLRERMPGARIVVVERDPSYQRASSRLATGGVRQQYQSALNVSLARHSVAWYSGFDARLGDAGCAVRAWFRQRGYLFLANGDGADAMERRFHAQRRAGAHVERWTRTDIATRVPGLVTGDIELGLFGPEDGYLDPRAVLVGMRTLAERQGADFVHGAAAEVERTGGRVSGVRVNAVGGMQYIGAPTVVNAAGAYAGIVGDAAGVSLPIVPVRQHLFRLALEVALPSRIPMIFDPDGTHWRLDDALEAGGEERLVIGRSRPDAPAGASFECDDGVYGERMQPTLERRYPAARVRAVVEGWAGLYEMTPDHNALLGEHPALPGFVVAAGFSGHGLMMAPATGLAIAELVADGQCSTFDIGPLAVDRFERNAPFVDDAMV